MLPYVFLIAFVFLARGFTLLLLPRFSPAKANALYVKAVFIYLYIFCVIRNFNVGIDIPGYISMYDVTATKSWSNWDYVYFENGYILLMKICNMIGLSARGFLCVVYALILIPIYILIKRETKDPLLSIIIFLCFQFFVFDLTGLRQAIAMSICMIAFLVAQKHGKTPLIIFIALVYGASMIHRSALAFALAYIIIRLPINKKMVLAYAIGAVVCFIINKAGVAAILEYYNNSHYGWSNDDSSQLGLSLLLIVIFAITGVYSCFKQESATSLKICQASTNMVLAGVCMMFLVNGSTLLRATMYFYFPIIILAPMIVKSFGGGIDKIAKYAMIILFVTHFFINEINSFNVTPYEIANNLTLTK